MEAEELILVTVVAEAVLEHRLVRDVAACGAHGWTVCDARGRGSRGVRADEFEGSNVRLEALVSAEVASRFLEVLARHRRDLEQQREDIEITLAEISLHEARCRQLLAAGRPRRRTASATPATPANAAASAVAPPAQETLP